MMKLVFAIVMCAFVAASPSKRQAPTTGYNPCTPQALVAGKIYFAVPGDKHSFIECDYAGNANIIACSPGLVWDESKLSCAYEFTLALGTPAPGSNHGNVVTDPNLRSYCTPENIAANKLYFAHPDKNKFIQCDLWGDAFVLNCPPKLLWDSFYETCAASNVPAFPAGK